MEINAVLHLICILRTMSFNTSGVVRALNVRKGHTISLLDKSMKFGTDELDTILFQNFDGSNLRC